MVAGREAIAHHDPAKGAAQQLDGGSRRPLRTWMNTVTTTGTMTRCQPHFPVGLLPSALPVGGGAGFINVSHRLLTSKGPGPPAWAAPAWR